MKPALFPNALCDSGAPVWPHILGLTPAKSHKREVLVCSLIVPFVFTQDRATFRRLIVKNNAKKRRMYETFIESVPLLKSLEVGSVFCWFVASSPLISFQTIKINT